MCYRARGSYGRMVTIMISKTMRNYEDLLLAMEKEILPMVPNIHNRIATGF